MASNPTATQQVIKSALTYRLRPPPGLESTLLKELKTIRGIKNAKKITGRKIIEVSGPQEMLWEIMYKSRIAEDIQVRVTQPFLARGEKELEQNLQKVPWHCYLPYPSKNKPEHEDISQFKMPQTRAKCHMSKLFHTQLVRDILIESMTDAQIRRDFKKQQMTGISSFKAFKKEWLQRKQADEKREVEKLAKKKVKGDLGDEVEIVEDGKPEEKKEIKGLEQVRAEIVAKREFEKNLKSLSKVQVNIVKDKAEVLLSTSHEELHKHGYKPFVRWGVLKETLTAACLLESGILQRAQKTGKLFLWDPFCGSGSFIIESIMMLLDQPVRNYENGSVMPFEYWPIHEKELYQQFKEELNDFQKMRKRQEIDVWVIGSDRAQRAFETTCKNIEYSEIQKLIEEGGLLQPREHPIIKDPMILSQSYPKSAKKVKHVENQEISNETGIEKVGEEWLQIMKDKKEHVLGVYQGDFQDIGERLAGLTDGFKDFSIITNVPYGVQSKENQKHSDTDLHRLYRRFGRLLLTYPNLNLNAYVVAQAHHYGHKLSFEKFSNCGWSKELTFVNGGIGVHLLKLDASKVSESKQTLEAYKEIDRIGEERDKVRKQPQIEEVEKNAKSEKKVLSVEQ